MNRHVGFYLLVPSISTYLFCMSHFIYTCLGPFWGCVISEGHVIFSVASAITFIPISIVVILTGNTYAPLFKRSIWTCFLLYCPIPICLCWSIFIG
ncbi:MAG: hypothetical protein VW378_05590 [bacterium]